MKLRSSRTVGENTDDILEPNEDSSLSPCTHQQPSDLVTHYIFESPDYEMDYESTFVTYKGSTAIRLEKWQDWPLWYDQLKMWCTRNEIWDDVCPEVIGDQPENIRPQAPSLPAVLDAETRANFQIQNAVYSNDLRIWREKDLALKQLDETLKTTVGDQFKQHLMGKLTERAKLRALYEQVKPIAASLKADLNAEYELLKLTPYGKSVSEYFSRWQILCVKCQTSNHSIFVTGEEDPSLALHEALQPIHPVTAIFRTNKVNDNVNSGEKVKLLDEIKAWQTFLNSKAIVKFPTKTSARKNAAFPTATLEGKDIEHTDRQHSNKSSSKQLPNQRSRPECLCGKFHDIYRCNYLNPNWSRPSWWKPNKDVKDKIERYCRNNPDFAGKVQHEIEKWQSERKSKKKESGNTAASTETADYSEDDNIGAATLSGSASCSLYSSVILDSGTNVHVINDAMYHRIIDSRKATASDKVYSGDGILQATAVIQAEVRLNLGEKSRVLTLNEALCIPSYISNLVSLKRLNKVNIHRDSLNPLQLYQFVNNQRRPWANLSTSKSRHWILEDLSLSGDSACFAASSAPRKPLVASPSKWHMILGHPGIKAIESLSDNVEGCEFNSKEKLSTVDCEPCLLSKAKAIISRRSETNREISTINEEKHMVVVSWDIVEFTTSLDGSKYMSHFYYDAELFHHFKCTKTKAEAAAHFKIWFPKAEQLFGARTVFFRSDVEGSIGKEATKILDRYKLTRLSSAADTPAQNGAAEVSGKVIVETARTLRVAAGLPKNLWPWLCESAAHLLNRTPTKKLNYRTPFKLVTGKRPSLAHLHQIGCKVFALTRGIPKRDKMEERANIGYHLGYASRNIFYIWIPALKRVIRTRDVVFKDEMYDPLKDITLGQLVDEKLYTITVQRIEIPETDVPLDLDPYISSSVPLFQVEGTCETDRLIGKNLTSYSINGYPMPSPTVSREQTCEIEEESIGLGNSLDALEFVNLASANEYLLAFSSVVVQKQDPIEKQIHRDQLPPPPRTWKELIKHPFKDKIMAATYLEFNHLMQDTLEVENSYDGYAVPLKWIWTYKFDSLGFLTKFKCRLCVRGDLQLPILKDTYAATLAMKTFRSMMALMCAFGLESRQYDLVNAFCNAKLSPPIYCKTPPGFEHLGKTLKVKRALYGLRESPLLWSRTLKQALNNFGYEDVPGVDCLMRGHNIILLIYVDDIILLYWSHDVAKANEFENNLSSRFKITSCGEAKWFLGIEIIRDRLNKKIWLSQKLYCEKLGSKFNVEGRSLYPKIPLPNTSAISGNKGQASKSQIQGYQQKVGSVGYAAISTRPDVAKAHAVLAQYLNNPSDRCLELADHLLSYLYGSRNLDLSFDGRASPWEIYCDASFADNEDRKSSQGLLFKMFGGAVDWKATKQKKVTTSTTEAELLALSSIGSSSYWWRRLFSSLEFETDLIPTVFCDNKQSVRIANSESEILQTKLLHVDIHQL